MAPRTSFPAIVHIERHGTEAVVRPEPPAPGTTVFTRLDRLVERHRQGLKRVVVDAAPFRRFTERNVEILRALVEQFRAAGVQEFVVVNGPRGAAAALRAHGLSGIRARRGRRATR